MSKTLMIENKVNGHKQPISQEGWDKFKYKHLFRILPQDAKPTEEVVDAKKVTQEHLDAIAKAETPEEVDAIAPGVTTASVVKAKATRKAELKSKS